jgi:hypothetical protein
MRNPKLILVSGALALALAGPQAVDGASVLDDALQGSTIGTRSGGKFVAGGWQVVDKSDLAEGTGLVRLQGRSFWDDAGPFLGLGASYFQALRHAKYDRQRLNDNLALLASKGFNYVRILSMVSWDDTSNQGIISLYRGSAADLATVHFSRDIRTAEGGWLPVRDPYRAGNLPGVPPVSSNEPIGPGSSVNPESDPLKLCSAAVFAYLANLPAYVYHSRAGVYGYVRCCPPAGGEDRFENTAGINVYRFIREILPRDLASWVCHDGLEPSAPLTVFCNNQPNRYWPEASQPADGCVRNIGSAKGSQFVCFPMGILGGGVTLQARRPVRFQVFNPLTGAVVSNQTLNAGDRFTLPQGPGAYICKGRMLDVAPPSGADGH